MTVLPIAARELLAAARRPGMYRARLWFALLAVVITNVVLAFASISGSRQAGAGLFRILAWGTFGMCAFAGVLLTAEAIAGEQREGTLGLLFLTELRGVDVVSGKLIAAGVNAFGGVLAMIPVAAVAWILGGVEAVEFGRVVLVLLNTLALSLSLGLWVSSWLGTAGRNLAMTAGVVAVMQGVPFLSSGLAMMDALTTPVPGRFGWSLGLQHGLVWVLLGWTSYRLPRVWTLQAGAGVGAELPWAARLAGVEAERWWSERRRRLDPHLLAVNPVQALAVRQLRAGRLIPALVVLSLVLQVGVMVTGINLSWGLFGFNATHLTIVPLEILYAWHACAFFSEVRREGTAELLLTTPLTDREMISGQLSALRRAFRVPLVVWGMGTFLLALVPLVMGAATGAPGAVPVGGMAACAYAGVTLVVAMHALEWAGFWFALTQRTPLSAFGWTAILVGLVPLLVPCVPVPLTHYLQSAWFRGNFFLNLRSILQGRRLGIGGS